MRTRDAVLPDAEQIHALIAAYSGDGTLLPRTLAEICENVRDFVVLEHDGRIIGCGALHLYGVHLAGGGPAPGSCRSLTRPKYGLRFRHRPPDPRADRRFKRPRPRGRHRTRPRFSFSNSPIPAEFQACFDAQRARPVLRCEPTYWRSGSRI